MSELSRMNLFEEEHYTSNSFKCDIFYKLQKALLEKNIVFLLGPRKCGKTVCLMQHDAELSNSTLIDFKTISDDESVEKINLIIEDVINGVDKVYLLDEVTYMSHPEEEIARIAQAYTKAISTNVNIKTKIVFTGSQSVALHSWGKRAFCSNASYVIADFLNYVEWLSYKKIADVSEDTFKQFIAGTKAFYQFTSLRDYLEGCLEETVTSNIKSKNLVVGNECSALDADILLTVLYATLFSLHDHTNSMTFFKNNSLEDRLRYLINSNQIIVSFDKDRVKERIAKSFISKYNVLQSMDVYVLKQALIFLYKCGLITLTPVFSDFNSSMDVYKALLNDDVRLAEREKLFKNINICIKHPMFFVEILHDVLQDDFTYNISGTILGAIVECYVRGILPANNCFEYHSEEEHEIDYVNIEQMRAIEITISNKKTNAVWFDDLPTGFEKILLTKDTREEKDSVTRIPYYEFIYQILSAQNVLIELKN